MVASGRSSWFDTGFINFNHYSLLKEPARCSHKNSVKLYNQYVRINYNWSFYNKRLSLLLVTGFAPVARFRFVLTDAWNVVKISNVVNTVHSPHTLVTVWRNPEPQILVVRTYSLTGVTERTDPPTRGKGIGWTQISLIYILQFKLLKIKEVSCKHCLVNVKEKKYLF